MSNAHKLEFLVEDEKQVSIYYWDWLNASNDTIFILRDGKAYKQEGTTEIECDLASELSKLAATVDKQAKDYYERQGKQ